MNGRRQIAVLGMAATVLLLALALQFVRLRDVQRGDLTTAARPIDLPARIPVAISGWEARDEPLGPTELARQAVEQNLNFDDVCNRRYRKPGFSLGVYVAYWSAGRMPLQKVASHTPDRCWSESGWTCTDARFPVVLSTVEGARWAKNGEERNTETQSAGSGLDRSPSDLGSAPVQNKPTDQSVLQEEVGGQSEKAGCLSPGGRENWATSGLRSQPSDSVSLKPGYWRTFTPPGSAKPTYVLYWHLVGDELYDYGGGFNRRPRLVNWWRDMLRYAFAGSREQFFVRLTCDRPFEELKDDAGFQAIVEALGGLGLAAEPR